MFTKISPPSCLVHSQSLCLAYLPLRVVKLLEGEEMKRGKNMFVSIVMSALAVD